MRRLAPAFFAAALLGCDSDSIAPEVVGNGLPGHDFRAFAGKTWVVTGAEVIFEFPDALRSTVIAPTGSTLYLSIEGTFTITKSQSSCDGTWTDQRPAVAFTGTPCTWTFSDYVSRSGENLLVLAVAPDSQADLAEWLPAALPDATLFSVQALHLTPRP